VVQVGCSIKIGWTYYNGQGFNLTPEIQIQRGDSSFTYLTNCGGTNAQSCTLAMNELISGSYSLNVGSFINVRARVKASDGQFSNWGTY
jgi:hypothetical protein